MNDQKTITMLVLLGAVPFAAGGMALLIGEASLPLVGDTRTALALYGLTIVCFLTGIHWATQLYQPDAPPLNLFVFSNLVFLAAPGAYLAIRHNLTPRWDQPPPGLSSEFRYLT